MIKNFFCKLYLLDALLLSILIIISYTLISNYTNASFIDVGYQDWMMQAFRVKSLAESGYTSWTHVWSNGMDFWKTYQFVPHFITLFISRVTNNDITRTMVLLIIAQFILLRIFIYLTLRILKFTPLVSFICAFLSFDISQYWEGVGDYSLLFAFTIFPLTLLMWIKYNEGKIQYIFPYLIGLCFYIHILLGMIMSVLWLCSLIFSHKKILSKSTLSEFIILVISSSLFWYPLLIKHSYVYIDDKTSTRSFLDWVLSQYGNFGLSQIVIICLFASLIYAFIPKTKTYQWSKILLIFSFSYFIINIIGVSIELPKIIDQTQFTRGAAMLGIAILFVFAPLLSKLLSLRFDLIRGLIIIICFLAFIDSISLISIHSFIPLKKIDDPVHAFSIAHKNIHLEDGRIETPTLSISNYMNPISYRYVIDDMTQQEINQVSMRLDELISYPPLTSSISNASIDRLNDYFTITGTKYIFLNQSSSYASALIDNGDQRYVLLGNIALPHSLYEVLQTPWQPKDAVLIAPQYAKAMKHFPYSLQLSQVNDLTDLDTYVHQFAGVIEKSDNIPLSISYPTQESIEVNIPKHHISKLVYIDESYDTNWKAEINGESALIKPVGPNFILVTLPSLVGGTLLLQHSFPVSFYLSIYLILLLPIIFIVNGIIQKYFSTIKSI